MTLCPVCLRELNGPLAQASHYRAHVRRGELRECEYGIGSGLSFALPGEGWRSFREGIVWHRWRGFDKWRTVQQFYLERWIGNAPMPEPWRARAYGPSELEEKGQ